MDDNHRQVMEILLRRHSEKVTMNAWPFRYDCRFLEEIKRRIPEQALAVVEPPSESSDKEHTLLDICDPNSSLGRLCVYGSTDTFTVCLDDFYHEHFEGWGIASNAEYGEIFDSAVDFVEGILRDEYGVLFFLADRFSCEEEYLEAREGETLLVWSLPADDTTRALTSAAAKGDIAFWVGRIRDRNADKQEAV